MNESALEMIGLVAVVLVLGPFVIRQIYLRLSGKGSKWNHGDGGGE